MKSELAKNREINRYGMDTAVDEHDRATMKELDLADKKVNVQAVSKMIRDYSALEVLDLSGNVLGNHGAKDIAVMIEENNTIKKLKLFNC